MSDRKPISRRDLLRGRFLPDCTIDARGSIVMRYPKSTTDIETSQNSSSRTRFRRSIPLHRPPGAVEECTFLKDCTRCDACIDACPHYAIVHAPPRFREAASTPMIDPDHSPCYMCEDLPCIDVCEPDVLSRAVPIMMGTARITNQTCLAYHNQSCTVCSEQCPVEGAIEVIAGQPRIVEETCTGCGVCRYVCPSPENAILLMPTFQRPGNDEQPAAPSFDEQAAPVDEGRSSTDWAVARSRGTRSGGKLR